MPVVTTISFVIPVYNEGSNLKPMFEELQKAADALKYPYEIIFIDDGSTDKSLEIIKNIQNTHECVKYLAFDRNRSKSAALWAGFQHATGDTIITLDADLQNDPKDIPHMLEHYAEYDMVNGWRHNRQDTISKKIGSKIGNTFRNRLTYESIIDSTCCMKVMSAEYVKKIRMFRGLHRFLPTIMRLEGAKVTEVKINDRPRLKGMSKYTNSKRAITGFYDVLAVRWMVKRYLKLIYKEKSL